jgi:hypothetical protein
MVELARQGGDTAGVVTLFKLGETMQTTDSVGVALAIGCSSWLAMRARALPAVVGWLGVVVATWHVIEGALQTQGVGVVGPIGIILGLLWVVITGVVLLVRPVNLRQLQADVSGAPA